MAGGFFRVLKPVMAGMALAYLATAFVDGPPPINFLPENPYSAKQQEIVETQSQLVIKRNIMKLGSPLSVNADGDTGVPANTDTVGTTEVVTGSTIESDLPPDPAAQGGPEVKGEVQAAPEPE